MATIGHSYPHNGIISGATATTQPLIGTNNRSIDGALASINQAVREDFYWALNEGGLNIGSVTGTFNVGDTLTQTSSGATATITASSATHLSFNNVSATFVAGAVTSSSGGSATASTPVVANFKGSVSALQGDFLANQNGFPGVLSRVAQVLGQTNPPKILNVNGAVNSLLNGVTASTAITQTKAIYDAIRAHPNGANVIVLIYNSNPFTSGSGFNTAASRQAIADYNTGLASAMQSWTGFGSTVYYINQFSTLLTSTTSLTADAAAFAAGNLYGDPTKFSDTLHPNFGGRTDIAVVGNATLAPLVAAGDWFAATYTGGTNSITSPNAAMSGTAGGKSGTSVTGTVVTGLSVAGPSSASTVVCSVEAGDGTSATQFTPVGKSNQVLTYTNAGVTESIGINWNTVTTGIGAAAYTGWVQLYVPIWHDGADVIVGISASHANGSSALRAIAESYDGTVLSGVPHGIGKIAGRRVLITPPFFLDGTQAANAKVSMTINALASKPGTQAIKILPGAWLGTVADPR